MYPSYDKCVTVLPLKLFRVMPVKVEIAPDVGDDDRNCWIVVIDGSVSNTSIMSDDVLLLSSF